MASLRRMASLDCIPSRTSSPACSQTAHLIRHSSLPNHFLCQPELAIVGALSKPFSLNKSTLHTSPKSSILRARSSNHSFDSHEISEAEMQAEAGLDIHASRIFQPLVGSEHRGRRSSPTLNKRSAIAAEQGLDLEKSVVYADLRESVCAFGAPGRFFKPYDVRAQTQTLHVGSKGGEHESLRSLDLHVNEQERHRDDVKERPMSLRMLKRKLSKIPKAASPEKQCKPGDMNKLLLDRSSASQWAGTKPPLVVGVGDSVSSAFTSLVYMLKMLHQHALSTCMRSHAGIAVNGGTEEKSLETWVGRAYAEMLDSFLWLFQQVFSCTPMLMLLIMMLLADFTLHSVSRHIALPVVPLGEPPTTTALAHGIGKSVVKMGCNYMQKDEHFITERKLLPEEYLPEVSQGDHGGSGSGIDKVIKCGGGFSEDDGLYRSRRKKTPKSRGSNLEGDDAAVARFSASSTLPSSSLLQIPPEMKGADLDPTTKNMLVAPVRAPAIEADNYPCFDKTDLAYQHEISMDPTNPLLLANYAQFLHVVRHDHGRAEKLYRRAMMAEGHVDGDLMGRFASFLWIAKGDVAEADDTFQAAIAADPMNAYHAGCYAHFLWTSSACNQGDETCRSSTKENTSTVSRQTPTA